MTLALGGSQTVVSEERKDKDGKKNDENVVIQLREKEYSSKNIHQRGMVLPVQPLSMAFNNINYYINVPPNVLVSVLSNYMVDTDWLLSALLVALVAHIEGIVQNVTLQVNASVDCLGGLWFCFGDSCVHFYGPELEAGPYGFKIEAV
ncbi:hypothetical protein Tco_1387575, partial [Tanacetum coccineum]